MGADEAGRHDLADAVDISDSVDLIYVGMTPLLYINNSLP